MNFIAPEQVAIYFINFIFLFFLFIILKTSFEMIYKFDFNSSTSYQYKLEKRNVLISTIVSFFIIIKVLLIFFFMYFIDSLSPSIPGAMCAVGVLNSTPYGAYLVVVKILVIFMLGYWYYINKFDLKNYGFKFTKLKYKFLLFISVFILLEFLTEIDLFNSISPEKIVSCCGSVFGGEVKRFSTFLFDLENHISVFLFLITLFLLILFFLLKRYLLFSIFTIVFLIVAIYSLIDFFGLYIYELPTHRCPFCMLQKDYFFVGYILYFLLFFGSFYGSNIILLRNIADLSTKKRWFKLSFIYLCLYSFIVIAYVISYYLRRNAWL